MTVKLLTGEFDQTQYRHHCVDIYSHFHKYARTHTNTHTHTKHQSIEQFYQHLKLNTC